MRLLLNQLRSSGYNIKHEVLVGKGNLAKQYLKDLASEPELGIQVDEQIEADDDIDLYLTQHDVNEVVIALEADQYSHITRHISVCEKHGIRYSVIPFYSIIGTVLVFFFPNFFRSHFIGKFSCFLI